MLISWTRLLSGRLRDPLVGRDILVGHLAGAVLAMIAALSALNGLGESLGLLIEIQPSATFSAIVQLFLIVLLRMLFRKPWIAVGGTLAIMIGLGALASGGDLFEVVFAALVCGVVLVVLLRVGILAAILSFLFATLILHLPLTGDLSAWYAPWALGVLALGFALTVYGYFVSLAGRPLLKDVLDGE